MVPIHGDTVFWWYSGPKRKRGENEEGIKPGKCEVTEAIGVWDRGVWRESSTLSDVALKTDRPQQVTLRGTIPAA